MVANSGVAVDAAFVLPPEHRPNFQTETDSNDNVPSIDLSNPDRAALVSEIAAACADWGFFQIVNHGVPAQLLQSIRRAAAEFFALPLEEKLKVKRDVQNPVGYFDTELTKNTRDWKEVFDFVARGVVAFPADSESAGSVFLSSRWPERPKNLQESCERYSAAVEKLCFELLGLISLGLGLPFDHFQEKFQDHTSMVRLNHYPPCPAPDVVLGVSRHKDPGVLTVLAQDDDVQGLQVKRKDGVWVGVKPAPGSFVVNVGDCIQVWSNDRYQSVEHRVVVNEKKERFSIPYFFNASHYVTIEPIRELLTENESPMYKAYSWGEFHTSRKNSNFKNLGKENLQIYDFRI